MPTPAKSEITVQGLAASKGIAYGQVFLYLQSELEIPRYTVDPDKRAALYHQIQEITTTEVSQIPLYYPPFTNAYSSRIEGLRMTPALQWTLEEAEAVE